MSLDLLSLVLETQKVLMKALDPSYSTSVELVYTPPPRPQTPEPAGCNVLRTCLTYQDHVTSALLVSPQLLIS